MDNFGHFIEVLTNKKLFSGVGVGFAGLGGTGDSLELGRLGVGAGRIGVGPGGFRTELGGFGGQCV